MPMAIVFNHAFIGPSLWLSDSGRFRWLFLSRGLCTSLYSSANVDSTIALGWSVSCTALHQQHQHCKLRNFGSAVGFRNVCTKKLQAHVAASGSPEAPLEGRLFMTRAHRSSLEQIQLIFSSLNSRWKNSPSLRPLHRFGRSSGWRRKAQESAAASYSSISPHFSQERIYASPTLLMEPSSLNSRRL